MNIKNHILCLLAAGCLLTGEGCKSTPNEIAYRTTAGTVATVDAGMKAWADYVHAERARIAALPVTAQGSQASDLTRAEGRVRDAYGHYQTAIAAVDVGATVASQDLVAAAAALVETIKANKH